MLTRLDLLAVAAVLGLLGALLVAFARLRPWLGAEGSRKALHTLMGLAVLPVPWLFDTPAPVVVLAVLATAVLGLVRTRPALRRHVGCALHDVERATWGDLAFPAGAAGAFFVAGGAPEPYVGALLVLALADPAAAIVGQRVEAARTRGLARAVFATPGGRKTLAGTLACACVGWGAAAVGLGALGVSAAAAVELGALAALAGAAAEAATGRGLDNATVPVAVAAVLAPSPVPVALRLAAVVGLALAALAVAARAPRRALA